MRIRYDEGADVLLVVLHDDPPVDMIEEPVGVIVSYGANGELVSVEFLAASARRLIREGAVTVTLESGNRSWAKK